MRRMESKSFYDMNEAERRHRINQAWRHLARRIFVFLKANPDVLASNNNQEVFDVVREIQIKYRLKQTAKYTKSSSGLYAEREYVPGRSTRRKR